MSRFANKNTIALGLGCVGSGGLVLGTEVVLRMGTDPSTEDEALLYGFCAGAGSIHLSQAGSLPNTFYTMSSARRLCCAWAPIPARKGKLHRMAHAREIAPPRWCQLRETGGVTVLLQALVLGPKVELHAVEANCYLNMV